MSVTISGYGQSITLPDPDFEDTFSIEHLRVNEETRNGTRIIYRDPSWPRVKTFDYKFSDLSQRTAWDVLDFIQLTLGLPITLIDYWGITWSGIILNPDAAIGQDSRSSIETCGGGFNLELKFEGESQ